MPPTIPALYLGMMGKCFPWHIVEWTGEYWCYPGNYVDIVHKYNEHVGAWRDLPVINDRSEQDPPAHGTVCVVHLLSERADDHGFAIATYDAPNMTFKFIDSYKGWEKDYDDWQFDAFGIIA